MAYLTFRILNTTILFYLVCYDCLRRTSPFYEPIEEKLVVLREALTSPSFAQSEKVITVTNLYFV